MTTSTNKPQTPPPDSDLATTWRPASPGETPGQMIPQLPPGALPHRHAASRRGGVALPRPAKDRSKVSAPARPSDFEGWTEGRAAQTTAAPVPDTEPAGAAGFHPHTPGRNTR